MHQHVLLQWNGLELLDAATIGGNYSFKIGTDVEHENTLLFYLEQLAVRLHQ